MYSPPPTPAYSSPAASPTAEPTEPRTPTGPLLTAIVIASVVGLIALFRFVVIAWLLGRVIDGTLRLAMVLEVATIGAVAMVIVRCGSAISDYKRGRESARGWATIFLSAATVATLVLVGTMTGYGAPMMRLLGFYGVTFLLAGVVAVVVNAGTPRSGPRQSNRGVIWTGAISTAAVLAICGWLALSSNRPDAATLAAIRESNVNAIAKMAAEGVGFDRTLPNGDLPLHLASEVGEPQVIEVMLAKGADPNKRDKDGRTAAMRAAGNGKGRALAMLKAAGADITGTDASGNSVMHLVLLRGIGPEEIMPVLGMGLPVNAANKAGETPALLAAKCYRPDAEKYLRELVAQGADLRARDASGQSVVTRMNLRDKQDPFTKWLKDRGAID
jgi:hypothetical protein